ncbi:uncharacterized protein K452DRAFT_340229, partial [Aplosporella prunicola CBS 121167]
KTGLGFFAVTAFSLASSFGGLANQGKINAGTRLTTGSISSENAVIHYSSGAFVVVKCSTRDRKKYSSAQRLLHIRSGLDPTFMLQLFTPL